MTQRLAAAGNYLFRSRLVEYGHIIEKALKLGYYVGSVSDAYRAIRSGCERLLILRHDVDDLSPGLKGMLDIEARYGVKATYYFRWSTAAPEDVRLAKGLGHEVSLHYETLATYAERRDINKASDLQQSDYESCAEALQREVEQFRAQFDVPCLTLASHGAPRNRLIGQTNAHLFARVPNLHRELGIELEVYDEDFLAQLDTHVSDTQWEINDGYRYGVHPLAAIDRYSRISFLTHPNHWGFSARVRARRIIKGLLKGNVKVRDDFAFERSLRKPPVRPHRQSETPDAYRV